MFNWHILRTDHHSPPLITYIAVATSYKMADNGDSKSFKPEVESVEEFLDRLKVQNPNLLVDGTTDSAKRTILINSLPVNVINDIQQRLKPVKLSEATFPVIETNLLNSYTVKKSYIGATLNFVTRKQKPFESIEQYSKQLNNLASQCNYADCCRDRQIRDIFLSGLKSTKLLASLIPDCEDKTFVQCVTKAKNLEQVMIDVDDIHPEQKVHDSYRVEVNKRVPNDYVCFRCSARGKHFVDKCFALKLSCNRCRKTGHVAKACKSRQRKDNGNQSYTNNSHHISSDRNYNQADSNSLHISPEEVDQAEYVAMNTIRYGSNNSSFLGTGN